MSAGGLSTVPVAPGGHPLLGHLWQLWRRPLEFLGSLRPVGDIVRVDLARWPVYVVTTPQLHHQVLATRSGVFVRGRIYDRARSVFGDGLATSEGTFHRQQRRLVQPAFHHQRIAAYADIMARRSQQLADSWHPGQRVELEQAMYELTLKVVANVLFSRDLGKHAVAEVNRLIPIIMAGLPLKMATPERLDGWPVPRGNRRFDVAARSLRALVHQLIDAYRDDPPDAESTDLLSLLLATQDPETGAGMTDEQVCDEVVSLLMAGTETSGGTLAWAFHELSRHPEIERRVHAEAATVLGGRAAGYSDVPNLVYIGRVLTEVQRLHPVLLFTRRTVTETELGGVRIPPGTEIAYSPHALHRDPDAYPEPFRFDPDRWLPDPAAGDRPKFIPFGAGQHKCLGDSFASTEMTIVLATIAARWRLVPTGDHQVREVPAQVPRPDALPMIATPWF